MSHRDKLYGTTQDRRHASLNIIVAGNENLNEKDATEY